MSSLYDSTSNTRKLILIFLILILGYLIVNFFNSYNEFRLQTPVTRRFYMDYDGRFGAIPPASIPGITVSGNPTYTLESSHATLSFPDVAYVHEINQPRESLQSFERALEVVSKLGFNATDYSQNGDVATWRNADGSRVLNYNRRLQQWELKTNYTTNVNALGNKNVSSDVAIYNSQGRSVISEFNFNGDGYFNDGTFFSKFAAIGLDGIFVEPELIQRSAEYAFVDIYKNLPYSDLKPASQRPSLERGEVEPLPVNAMVYTSDPRQGQVRFVVSNRFSNFVNDVFEMYFTNFDYTNNSGKYFVVTPDEAWNNVTQGGGSLVFIQPQNTNYFSDTQEVAVSRFIADARRTEIGYWEPETWQRFVYPIYIFRGRAELQDGRLANFIIFIDAIKRV